MYNNLSLLCVGTCAWNENKAVFSHLRSYQFPSDLLYPPSKGVCSLLLESTGQSPISPAPSTSTALLRKMNTYPANTHLVQLASGEHHFLGYSSKIKQTQNEFTDYAIHL